MFSGSFKMSLYHVLTTGVGDRSVGLSACLRHESAKGPGFESHCCLLTTGPLCHRCVPTCQSTESKHGE